MPRYEEALQELGLRSGATLNDIKSAWRDLAMVWHPDRLSDDPSLRARAEARLRRTNAAYHFLKELQHPRPVPQSDANSASSPMSRAGALACLGLGLDATPREIEQAWRDLSRVWQPDRFPGDARLKQKAENQIQTIEFAFSVLRGRQNDRPNKQRSVECDEPAWFEDAAKLLDHLASVSRRSFPQTTPTDDRLVASVRAFRDIRAIAISEPTKDNAGVVLTSHINVSWIREQWSRGNRTKSAVEFCSSQLGRDELELLDEIAELPRMFSRSVRSNLALIQTASDGDRAKLINACIGGMKSSRWIAIGGYRRKLAHIDKRSASVASSIARRAEAMAEAMRQHHQRARDSRGPLDWIWDSFDDTNTIR